MKNNELNNNISNEDLSSVSSYIQEMDRSIFNQNPLLRRAILGSGINPSQRPVSQVPAKVNNPSRKCYPSPKSIFKRDTISMAVLNYLMSNKNAIPEQPFTLVKKFEYGVLVNKARNVYRILTGDIIMSKKESDLLNQLMDTIEYLTGENVYFSQPVSQQNSQLQVLNILLLYIIEHPKKDFSYLFKEPKALDSYKSLINRLFKQEESPKCNTSNNMSLTSNHQFSHIAELLEPSTSKASKRLNTSELNEACEDELSKRIRLDPYNLSGIRGIQFTDSEMISLQSIRRFRSILDSQSNINSDELDIYLDPQDQSDSSNFVR